MPTALTQRPGLFDLGLLVLHMLGSLRHPQIGRDGIFRVLPFGTPKA